MTFANTALLMKLSPTTTSKHNHSPTIPLCATQYRNVVETTPSHSFPPPIHRQPSPSGPDLPFTSNQHKLIGTVLNSLRPPPKQPSRVYIPHNNARHQNHLRQTRRLPPQPSIREGISPPSSSRVEARSRGTSTGEERKATAEGRFEVKRNLCSLLLHRKPRLCSLTQKIAS